MTVKATVAEIWWLKSFFFNLLYFYKYQFTIMGDYVVQWLRSLTSKHKPNMTWIPSLIPTLSVKVSRYLQRTRDLSLITQAKAKPVLWILLVRTYLTSVFNWVNLLPVLGVLLVRSYLQSELISYQSLEFS